MGLTQHTNSAPCGRAKHSRFARPTTLGSGSAKLGPRWIRATAVRYEYQRSPTAAKGSGNRRSLTFRLKQRTIAWLLDCRRLPVRYDRTDARFYPFVLLACSRSASPAAATTAVTPKRYARRVGELVR